jgi:hypothetical protein
MVRYVLEKPANFNDIKRAVLHQEVLEIDTTLHAKCGKPQEGISVEQLTEIMNSVENDQEMTCIDCGFKQCYFAQRAVIYSLICAMNQYKKAFSLDILQYVVDLFNKKKRFEFFKITNYSTLVDLFVPKEEIDIDIPAISEKQVKLLISLAERVIYSGISLHIWLLNTNLTNLVTAEFAVYMEAVGCDSKFLEDVIAMNVENRGLINQLTIYEKFFFKRNNKKGKGSPEMLEYCLNLLQVNKDLKDLKFKLKDFFGGEFNPTLKKTYYETKFLSKIWKSTSFALQRLTLTLVTLIPQISSRAMELVQIYYGEEKQAELFIEVSQIEPSFNIGGSNSYITALKNCLASIVSYRAILGYELGICRSIILDRLFKDRQTQLIKNKKKPGFRLGEGSVQVLETVFFEEALDQTLGELFKPKEEGEEEPEGEVMQENPGKGKRPKSKWSDEDRLEKEFPIEKVHLPWYKLDRQQTLKDIFAQILEKTRRPKVAKGVRDSDPIQMCIKNRACTFIKDTFRKHGAVEIDTPVFEPKETLMGKYGEEGGKLIYDLKDQGGELLSLRYDLTVPFARYCSTNNVQKIKRFHLGKVWRRDQPNFSKGRFREFHQCDIDIAGKSGTMIADAEILGIANEIMSGLGLSGYEIKVCDRRLLEAVIEVAGAPIERFKTICSSIDKLDKEPWEKVAEELINEKGIKPEAVANLEGIVQNRGKPESNSNRLHSRID